MSGLNEWLRILLFLPDQSSTISRSIDHLHFFVIIATMIASAVCGTTALLLFVRYRRRRQLVRTERVVAGFKFEAASVIIPLTFFLAWFVMGFRAYIRMATPPKDAMDVYVMGKMWMWKFSYPGGPSGIEILHVPAHRPVRLLMTSRDTIHSFFVPSFRIKQDVLPGKYTQTWFEALTPGRYQIMCAELCGIGHSQMWGWVIVHEPAEYDEWLSQQRKGLSDKQDMGRTDDAPPISDLVEQGRRVAAQAGCFKCHSIDGSPHIGPTWLDLYQRNEKMQTGEVLPADEAYLTQSMMDPLARVVAGYPPVMPTYQGRLSAPEIASLLEYIKSLQSVGPTTGESKEPVYEPSRPR